MRSRFLVLACLLCFASAASAQIDPDFDDCQGKAAILDTRWDLIDADPATELGVKAGFSTNGTWYLNAQSGDLVRAWFFIRSCDGVAGIRADFWWYDNLLDLVSWEPGASIRNVRNAPFRYSTANGGLANGGYSRWNLTYDWTHQSPTGTLYRLSPGEVLDLGFIIFRVTGENEELGIYRVQAFAGGAYTYDYKLVGDIGEIYSNRQDSTLVSLLDPAAFLPAGEFPLFAGPPPEADICTADINGDGVVGVPDFQALARHFGKCVDLLNGGYVTCP